MFKRKEGFSFIELMIVIALIGIASAILIPAYNDYTKKHKNAKTESTSVAYEAEETKNIETLIVDLTSTNPDVKLDAIKSLLDKNNPAPKQPEIIDWLVTYSAGLINENAEWIDNSRGHDFYDTLKRYEGNLVTDSLIRHCINSPEIRLRVLFLGVKLGIPGSQTRLNDLLVEHGDKQMAEDFLNSGSRELYEGGKSWGEKNGYFISSGYGSHRIGWGRF